MKVLGVCGGSGSGKTTLIESLLPCLQEADQYVSVVKHAHHGFEPDTPGKDSWRHRQAGAFEVIAVSDQRMALYREFPTPLTTLNWRGIVSEFAEIPGGRHWVLIEGFKHADLPKIEVWRAATGKPALYPADPFVVGVATDDAPMLPDATRLPVFPLHAPHELVQFLLADSARFEFNP